MAPSMLNPREDPWESHRCAFGPDGTPSTQTVLCTIVIILFTILTEVVVHTEKVKPNPSTSLPAETPANDNEDDPETQQAPKESKERYRHCNPNPKPSTRAFRLVTATFLLVPILVAFGFRIHTATTPHYYCRAKHLLDHPNWFAITILNIFPFMCASTAWLRAVVSCVLVRWDRGLEYWVWPPVLPIWVVLFPFLLVGVLLWQGAEWLMGRDLQKEEETELDGMGEEGRAFLGDGEEREEDEETLFGLESPRERKSEEGLLEET